MQTPRQQARAFVETQQQFQLGFLPSEQSHPRTKTLSQTIAGDTAAGIEQILAVDEDIVARMREVLAAGLLDSLVEAMQASIRQGGRILFSGCGATGRLSILLDAMWRRFWQGLAREKPDLAAVCDAAAMEPRTESLITGGDRALIRSVENFEDFQSFGRRQMNDLGVGSNDTVVAVSEGGETSSVIGSAWAGVEAGARVFFVFNNPADLLSKHIRRSAELINHPAVTAIDLTSGPMAVAGSTRMQATTAEQLLLSSALERLLRRVLAERLGESDRRAMGLDAEESEDCATRFDRLSRGLRQPASLKALAKITEREETLYRRGGRVTYFADAYLLDILTDTTERAPTFMLPPFRTADDSTSPPSWAFLKHPAMDTPDAWRHVFAREIRGLEWDRETYQALGAPGRICDSPPPLAGEQILRFAIGREDDPSRYEGVESLAMAVLAGGEVASALAEDSAFRKGFETCSQRFRERAVLAIGPDETPQTALETLHVPCPSMPSLLKIWEHLAVKLCMNTLSTATMARMGRVAGNWMVCAEATNKKLIDRGTRLIQSFTGVDYLRACEALHEVLAEQAARGDRRRAPEPPSVLAIRKLDPDNEVCR